MEKVKVKHFNYNLYKSSVTSKSALTVIFYHGWGASADSYKDVAEEIAKEGHTVIVPEIIYHDTRNSLENHFEKATLETYFWKTIIETIEEFNDFFGALKILKENTILLGSSMGGFIANGIFATQANIGGLANINGSGSFLVSERIFREIDNRPDIPLELEMILKKVDPIGRKNRDSPVLLIHGDSDKTVPIDGQKNYYNYLTENEGRKDIELLIYKDVNHQFTTEMLQDLITWLKMRIR
ncbi:prolyl oligopeptidase family serine peptidase [Sporosarcina sp. ANT_H38]|uniref:alpha/beta hydrolase n=1 Tax=Sporosarcina sp. ANT_H38 TaxID=2597358 RepID=UPI0011F3830E|nr:alpha/beta fold hydrolase [Sporosarcina sp. ANT_H38]KAA0955918.1 prolyl oligopeptidase family serine peptidase [Sporosarcina sp. ANT_H38]